MSLSRRYFFKLSSATLAAAAVAQNNTSAHAAPEPANPAITSSNIPFSATDHPILRFLNRAGYGPRPGDYERVSQMGLEAYLEEQLNPQNIDDTAVETAMQELTVYNQDASELSSKNKSTRRKAAKELVQATILRAAFSNRQLYQVMVEFWSDHFNIGIKSDNNLPLFKMLDDREVIRPHALGKFRDLLFASANSPAMLVYLDNVRSRADRPDKMPNENYPRELMELHTLDVNGGYTQQDVEEAARVFSGWGVRKQNRALLWQREFKAEWHDDGQKQILGQTFPAGQGEQDVLQLLELLATHASTAHFIATKLVRRFVADEPPESLVIQVTESYQNTDGDIKEMLRVIFLSDEFANASAKLKRPFTFVISAIRALDGELSNLNKLEKIDNEHLVAMGQGLFRWPAPNGYPDVSAAWQNNFLPRWNFPLTWLANKIKGVNLPLERLLDGVSDVPSALDRMAGLLGQSLSEEQRTQLTEYVGDKPFEHRRTQKRLKEAAGVMMASPEFQWQ
jgi:uncharacterized protein (DUF1800 family)